MDKLLSLAADIGRAVLPVASDMAKQLLGTAAKGAARLGKRLFSAVISKRAKKVLRRGRKWLRITALVTGSIAVLSCAGLILARRD